MIKPTKINMVINLAILGLLIYLTVSVKQLQDKVFPDPNVMIPLMGMDSSKAELEHNIRTFLNKKPKKLETNSDFS